MSNRLTFAERRRGISSQHPWRYDCEDASTCSRAGRGSWEAGASGLSFDAHGGIR